jgi:hypothetical protein
MPVLLDVRLKLPCELYEELKRAARESSVDLTFTEEKYVAELVESELASRRLSRFMGRE